MLLIKNAKIFTMNKNNDILDKFSILVNNGKIEEIGKNINVSLDTEIIDAMGFNLYPGFVEAHCHLGLDEDSTGNEGHDYNEISAAATPQCRAIDGMYPLDRTVQEAVEGGVTSALICPGSANVIGGLCSAIKLKGNRIDDMIIKKDAAMKCAFGENPKKWHGGRGHAPYTRMGVASILRNEILKTKEYLKNRESGNYIYNMEYEAMIPVIKGEMPLKAHAHREDDIFTAIRIAKEFNLKMTLDHCTAGLNIAEQIAEEGFPAIAGPSLGHRTKYELKSKSFKTPKVLYDAGVKFAITTDSPVIPLQYLPLCAGMAVKEGLDEYEALKAITINAAEIAGIDERVGSIEVGKDADFVICRRSPLEYIDAGIYMTIIDGETVYKKENEI